MLKVTRFEFNMFGVNTYVVHDPLTRQALIIDPGMVSESENERLFRFIDREGLKVVGIINTHLHLDHAFGIAASRETYGVTPRASSNDFILGNSLPQQARMFGLPEGFVKHPGRFEPLTDGEELTLGSDKIRVISVAGHTSGGMAFYCKDSNWVITGDSLFSGSIGRTDLPGGNHKRLLQDIHTRLLTLPPQTIVYPGHGPSTTIAAEARSNPYL